MEMLRERIKGMELRMVEMIRHGQENLAIADRLHRTTRRLLVTADASENLDIIVIGAAGGGSSTTPLKAQHFHRR